MPEGPQVQERLADLNSTVIMVMRITTGGEEKELEADC